MMVTSELTGEVSIGVLLAFLVFWRRGRYIVLDQQGDSIDSWQLVLGYNHDMCIQYQCAVRNSVACIHQHTQHQDLLTNHPQIHCIHTQ
jgi:hypothetical protein